MPQQPQYLDENGNPIAASPKVYLDESGNPIGASPEKPTGTLSAAKPESWLHQAEDDFTQGGNRTIVGRGLGTLQGRGDRGYSGIDSGVSKETANFMGSPELGLLHAGESAQTIPQHPVKGALGTIGGLLESATIPGMIMGGPEATAAIDAVPSTKHAGQIFSDLDEALANHPIKLTEQTLQPLQRATELGTRGGTLPKSVNDLLNRSQAIIDPTYPELRDYQSNLSDLSREAKDSLNGKMLGQIGKVNKGVYQDIYDSLGPTGKADDYASAMKEFRQASQLKSAAKKIGAGAIGTGIGATVGPAAYHKLKALIP